MRSSRAQEASEARLICRRNLFHVINDEDLQRSLAKFQTQSDLQQSLIESPQYCFLHVRHRIVRCGRFASGYWPCSPRAPSCRSPRGDLQNQLIASLQSGHIHHRCRQWSHLQQTRRDRRTRDRQERDNVRPVLRVPWLVSGHAIPLGTVLWITICLRKREALPHLRRVHCRHGRSCILSELPSPLVCIGQVLQSLRTLARGVPDAISARGRRSREDASRPQVQSIANLAHNILLFARGDRIGEIGIASNHAWITKDPSSHQHSAARALQIMAAGLSEHWTAARSVDRGLTGDACREYYVTGVAFIALRD